MEQLDLEPFVAFMRSRGLPPERNIPYYASWVRRYLQSDTPGVIADITDKIRYFCEQLARKEGVQDWQIEQAQRAIELYERVFRKEGHPNSAPSQPLSDGETACGQMRELIRLRHYSLRTEQTYLDWVRRYPAYAKANQLDWQTDGTCRSYISYLATSRNVASSTQNQAFNALLFLHREVLKREMADITSVRAKRGTKLPIVLSVDEVRAVLKEVPQTARLMLELTYGAGLRVSETIRLRIKDLDFNNHLVFVRAGKGDKDRSSLLPKKLDEPLKAQIALVKSIHERDIAAGHGGVYLPFALDRKYPKAEVEFGWQYLFSAADLSTDPRSGKFRRHHVMDEVLQRAIRTAVQKAGIVKPATVHTLRHSFATNMLLKGVNIREVQKYLGHQSVETTMIYTHVIRGMDSTAESPLDEL
jgi:integron integrase